MICNICGKNKKKIMMNNAGVCITCLAPIFGKRGPPFKDKLKYNFII